MAGIDRLSIEGTTLSPFHTASGVQDEMDRVPRFLVFSAKRIADEAVEATLAGKSLCVPTFTYKFLVFTNALKEKHLRSPSLRNG